MSKPRMTAPTLRVLNILLAERREELSGADIARRGYIASGTLYPILLRLEEAGWLVSRWEAIDPKEAGRPRRRLYRITGVGAANAASVTNEIVAPSGATVWA